MKLNKNTVASVEGKEAKIQCVVSYDVITKWDSVEHKLETIKAKN